ncbi:MAG: S66 peptidase family protein [Bacilli bacterium]
MIPNKLKKGDEIRVIAPSRSMSLLNDETMNIATSRLTEMGFKVTFGKNVNNTTNDDFCCASIEDRVNDLHDAFKDKNVKAILTVIGGFNVNQILDYIDYELIKNNPKIICGFSDITALLNAIYVKTGLVTYYGPHFSSFGMKKGSDYTLKYFKKIFMTKEDIIIESSNEWSDDLWFLDQEKRNFIENAGIEVINNDISEGRIIGGNLCTLNLLQGTEYMPDLDNTILFIEDDDLVGDEFMREFDRNLQSLLHCYKNKKINGLVIGRAQIKSNMTNEKWINILKTKKINNIPIIINADFGHTTPIFTFPIGGEVKIDGNKITIKNI